MEYKRRYSFQRLFHYSGRETEQLNQRAPMPRDGNVILVLKLFV